MLYHGILDADSPFVDPILPDECGWDQNLLQIWIQHSTNIQVTLFSIWTLFVHSIKLKGRCWDQISHGKFGFDTSKTITVDKKHLELVDFFYK